MAALTRTLDTALISSIATGAGVERTAEFEWHLKFGGTILVKSLFGSTPDGNVAVKVYEAVKTSPAASDYASVPIVNFQIVSSASVTISHTFDLASGIYKLSMTNNDTTDSVTLEARATTIDTIA